MDGFRTGFFLDCCFTRNFRFFFLVLIQCKKHAKMSVFHMTEIMFFTPLQLQHLNFEIQRSREEQEAGARCVKTTSPPSSPPCTHESALENSAFSNVVIGLGRLAGYHFHAIVGTFLGPLGTRFICKYQSLHLDTGYKRPIPLK